MKTILKDAVMLLEACEADYSECEAYQLLRRRINEQTVEDGGALRLRTKEDGGFDARFMQSGFDPEATCRTKGGKVCRGYGANTVDAVGERGSAIVDYQCGENVTSDSQYFRSSIASMPEQEEERIIVADGALRYPHKIRDAAPKLRDALVNEVSSSLLLVLVASLPKVGQGLVAQRLLGKARRVKGVLNADVEHQPRHNPVIGHMENLLDKQRSDNDIDRGVGAGVGIGVKDAKKLLVYVRKDFIPENLRP